MGWALCGGVVACAIAWPLTFGVERYAAVRLSALSLGRARFVLSVVRRFGCPRYYLPEHVCGWALCGGSVARATTYQSTFWVGHCAAIRLPAPLPWSRTFGTGRCATIRLSALPLTRARLGLGVVPRFGCPRHYLDRARLWLGVVPRFGCLRHYLGRARLGLGVVPRFSCPRGYVAACA